MDAKKQEQKTTEKLIVPMSVIQEVLMILGQMKGEPAPKKKRKTS